MKLLLSVFLLVSFSVQANECLELSKCIEYLSKLTGKKYLFDAKEMKGGLQASSNLVITSDNADNLFTYILDMNGYSRIPMPEKDTYIIVPSKDMRYQALPIINVDSKTPPKLTANYDFYLMNFKFKNFEHGQLKGAANSIKPFISRYAMVIETGNTLAIQDNSMNLIKLYDLMKNFDQVQTKEEINNFKEKKETKKETKKDHEKKVVKSDEKKEERKEEKKREKK